MNLDEPTDRQVARALGIPVEEVGHEQLWDFLMGSCEPGAFCTPWLPDARYPQERVIVPAWEAIGAGKENV